jgi:hypothetical protein
MADVERTTMSRLDVGIAGVFLGDTPSQPVNITKFIKKKFESGRFGVQKTFWEPTFYGL